MLYFAADRLLANVIDTTSSHDTRQATISLWVLVFSLALMVCYLDTRIGTALILAYIARNAYRCSGSFSNAYSTYLVVLLWYSTRLQSAKEWRTMTFSGRLHSFHCCILSASYRCKSESVLLVHGRRKGTAAVLFGQSFPQSFRFQKCLCSLPCGCLRYFGYVRIRSLTHIGPDNAGQSEYKITIRHRKRHLSRVHCVQVGTVIRDRTRPAAVPVRPYDGYPITRLNSNPPTEGRDGDVNLFVSHNVKSKYQIHLPVGVASLLRPTASRLAGHCPPSVGNGGSNCDASHSARTGKHSMRAFSC